MRPLQFLVEMTGSRSRSREPERRPGWCPQEMMGLRTTDLNGRVQRERGLMKETDKRMDCYKFKASLAVSQK